MALHGLSCYLPDLREATEWDGETFGFVGEACHGPPSTVAVNMAWFTPTLVDIV